MAFTKTPTDDTYSASRLTLSREINARDGGESGKDEDLLNVFIEPVRNRAVEDNRHFIVKRSGLEVVLNSVAASSVRGMFFWDDQNILFYCVGNDVFAYNVVTTALTTISNPMFTTSGAVGFCLFQYSTGVTKVVCTDGTNLFTIDSALTIVQCIDADMPVHLPYVVYLDGYIFVAKVGTADIYNSNNDDPLAWTAGDVITAEMEGDNLSRIVKVNNYLLAFGTDSIEYFWDAGVATGSPLQRNDTPVKFNKYLAGFAQFGNMAFFIGVNEGGQPDVYLLKDFKMEPVGTPTVSRYLNSANTALSTWKGAVVSCKGHMFYVVNAGTERTYVYDIETKLWARWGIGPSSPFPIQVACNITNLNNSYSFLSISNESTIYKLNDDVYKDDTTDMVCMVTSEAADFGTMNRKSMAKISVIGDRPTTNANILIQWSDDDGQTYNTGLSTNMNQDLPCVYRAGSFRQRSFKLTYTNNTDFRIQALEVIINKGRA